MSDSVQNGECQAARDLTETWNKRLKVAIGSQVRAFRKQAGLTVFELASEAGLSGSMLSKIENGISTPSLCALKALSRALQVPITAFFRLYDEERDATFVRAGEGLTMKRRGTRSGHQYEMLGHTVGKSIATEPCMITLTEESEVFPVFQHSGMEFVYVIEGEGTYQHGNKTYHLVPGDSLFFDADSLHGPKELRGLPLRFLSVIVDTGHVSRGGGRS